MLWRKMEWEDSEGRAREVFIQCGQRLSHGKAKSRDLIRRRREPYQYLREGGSWQGKPQCVKALDENKLG